MTETTKWEKGLTLNESLLTIGEYVLRSCGLLENLLLAGNNVEWSGQVNPILCVRAEIIRHFDRDKPDSLTTAGLAVIYPDIEWGISVSRRADMKPISNSDDLGLYILDEFVNHFRVPVLK